jgi:polysaccharide biosynthesis protein PelF
MDDKLIVLMTTEGTYPFHQGGVSTWCDILVKELKSVNYVIYSILMDPFVTQKYKLPDSATLIKMPLWGTEEPSEHLTTPFSQQYLLKRRTSAQAIDEQFIPLFRELIEEILTDHKQPQRLARVMLELHLYFQHYEYKLSFKSEAAWELYKELVLRSVADSRSGFARPDIYCLIQSLGWLYRFLNILNTPVPKAHVTHASAAAFCGIPCVLSKLKDGTPFMLTEHGIYLREQYLSLGKREYSSFLNTFLIRMIHSITGLNYAYADQVSPVCKYNTRWELEFDVAPQKIQVIYNGVDNSVFQEAPRVEQDRPTVVTVARIDPLKDMVTLIKAAAVVKAHIPNVRFMIYGSVSVPSYYEECQKLREELELTETVIFAGHSSNIPAAYQSGDVIALTSISEAFPYSVVEAMMVGRPVISTDVGGIREALADTGLLVNPRDYDELAGGIVKLLQNPELRAELAEEARERALSYFTLERVLELHLKSYIKLAVRAHEAPVPQVVTEKEAASALVKQQLFMERAFAFAATGMHMDAIRHYRLAIMESPESPSVPLIVMEIAAAYNALGQYDKAFLEMEKHEALVALIHA